MDKVLKSELADNLPRLRDEEYAPSTFIEDC